MTEEYKEQSELDKLVECNELVESNKRSECNELVESNERSECDECINLFVAASRCHIKCIERLLKAGHDINEFNYKRKDKNGNRNKFGVYAPLHFACISVNPGNEECVKYLLFNDAKVNIIGHNGWTPLHLAVKRKNREVILILLSYGANQNIRDHDRMTPYDLATKDKIRNVFDSFNNRYI